MLVGIDPVNVMAAYQPVVQACGLAFHFGKQQQQSRYRPRVTQRVPGS